jgi:hypothetical protein
MSVEKVEKPPNRHTRSPFAHSPIGLQSRSVISGERRDNVQFSTPCEEEKGEGKGEEKGELHPKCVEMGKRRQNWPENARNYYIQPMEWFAAKSTPSINTSCLHSSQKLIIRGLFV